MLVTLFRSLYPFFCLVLFLGCNNTNKDQKKIDDFDRNAMLVNWADNIIIPSYEHFVSKSTSMTDAVESFLENSTVDNLQKLQQSFRSAYIAFQQVSVFEIGQTMDDKYRSYINSYPTDSEDIDENINTGDYDLSNEKNRDQQGFPAMDYLINGLAENDAARLVFYTTNTAAEAYKKYLKTLSEKILQLSKKTLDYWKNGYRDSFIANNDSGISSSLNLMGNAYIQYYEKQLRAGKIAIPLGLLTDGIPIPKNIEAYYDPLLPKQLLIAAVQNLKNFFIGKSFSSNSNGKSFKQYLDYLGTKNPLNKVALGDTIETQFDISLQAIKDKNLEDNFNTQLSTDSGKTIIRGIYDVLQTNLVFMKIDMIQALNIVIDYRDADGD